MSGVARRHAAGGAAPKPAPYSDASTDSGTDPERDMESDEYGSAERSGSEISDRDSVDLQDDEKKLDEAGNQIKAQVVDHDEDRRNPQYIPKRGTFYEHDDRTAPGAEDEGVAELNDGAASVELSHSDRGLNDDTEKSPAPALTAERRKVPKAGGDRWVHDKYNENDQAPKSMDEIKAVYGYDIRGEEGPPKALRRHRYGRGPNKYTRNWEDENEYKKTLVAPVRSPKGPPSVSNGKEFPSLQSKNERNYLDKRRKNDKKPKPVDSRISPDKNANDKIIHDNKVFVNKVNRIDKDNQEKKQTPDEAPRWKGRTPQKPELRKPGVALKPQNQTTEQIKPEAVSSPPKTISNVTTQLQSNPAVIAPLQENKLPSARKIQNQVPPRMQSALTAPTAAATNPAQAPAANPDSGTRGKRYSNLRQRPMPETYQAHQKQYLNDYQQSLPNPQTNQQSLPSIGNIPHQQTPPPLLQATTQHHQPIPPIHQQTPPAMHQTGGQIHQKPSQILQQPSGQQIHQQTSQIHQQAAQMHAAAQNAQILQQNQQIHPQTSQIPQIHQQAAQIHQQTPQIHQQTVQIHQQSPQLHQQTPPPALQQNQPHHQTPPPTHQSISRQQAAIPMRQVPRTHQQQIQMHSMSIQQAGLVPSQNYATPQLMAQNQYIQNPNNTVYGHVVPQVYPPPQAYAAPQHQPIPPQAIPPQALPPQALPPQALPPQPIPPQALPPHSYHHQTPAPQHQSSYPAHTTRAVFREPGITYYSPQEQKGAAPPTRRPTNAIPIVPPPSRDRGKSDSVPPPDNIDHIVDNMFVPRQGRGSLPRPGETPPRSLETARHYEDNVRQYDEKSLEERISKDVAPEIVYVTQSNEPLSFPVELDHQESGGEVLSGSEDKPSAQYFDAYEYENQQRPDEESSGGGEEVLSAESGDPGEENAECKTEGGEALAVTDQNLEPEIEPAVNILSHDEEVERPEEVQTEEVVIKEDIPKTEAIEESPSEKSVEVEPSPLPAEPAVGSDEVVAEREPAVLEIVESPSKEKTAPVESDDLPVDVNSID